MRCSHRFASASGRIRTNRSVGGLLAPFLLAMSMLPAVALASSLSAQDVGSQEKEFMGNGSVITVTVHDASGTPFPRRQLRSSSAEWFPAANETPRVVWPNYW
jgi:hypothetical protein